IIRAGIAWRFTPEAEVRLDGSWQRWSQFKNQCVVDPGQDCTLDANDRPAGGQAVVVNLPRDWHDAAKVRFGGAYWIVPQTEAFASFAYETSPVGSGHVDAQTFDSVRLYGTLGVRHKFSRSFGAALSYTYVYFVPQTVEGSLLPNYEETSRWPSANGRYTSE